MSKAVLVTGSSGFIGAQLCSRLEQQGYKVVRHHTATGDIASCALSSRAVDHVFHLAAKTFVPDSWSHPMSFYATNVLGTVNIAEYCRRYGASLTFVSSYLYGTPQFLPITEDHPLESFNPYSHTKLLAEDICRFYAQQFHITASVIRPFNIYGPGQSARFLIPALCKQVLDPAVHDITIADDRPRRDYLFVDDLIELLLCTLEQRGYEIYNAGSGSSVSPRELAGMIQRIAGTDKPVISRSEFRVNEVLDVVANCDKAQHSFGWRARVPLAEGLQKTMLAANYS